MLYGVGVEAAEFEGGHADVEAGGSDDEVVELFDQVSFGEDRVELVEAIAADGGDEHLGILRGKVPRELHHERLELTHVKRLQDFDSEFGERVVQPMIARIPF
jgi:hypothetical protein